MSRRVRSVVTAFLLSLTSQFLFAQVQGGRGGVRGGPPPTAKASAPIDLVGYWTAVVTEDWRVRMLGAPKGDLGNGAASEVISGDHSGSIPYKPEGVQAAMASDGNLCKAYGAAGVMRQPTHL